MEDNQFESTPCILPARWIVLAALPAVPFDSAVVPLDFPTLPPFHPTHFAGRLVTDASANLNHLGVLLAYVAPICLNCMIGLRVP